MALCALAVLGLLLCYGFVVRQAAQQGEAKRRVTALTIETTWRCKALRVARQRAECLQRAQQDPPADSEALKALVLSVAQGTQP